MSGGAFYLLGGLPYTGKKALISGAQEATKESPTYIYPEVFATNPFEGSTATAISEEEFATVRAAHGYLVVWKVGSCQYGISADIVGEVERGNKVIFTVPAENLQETLANLNSLTKVSVKYVEVVSNAELTLARAKDTEDKFNEKAFQKRVKTAEQALPKPEGLVRFANHGSLEEGVKALLGVVGFDALLDIPPKNEEERIRRVLKTCPPAEYLARTVYPTILPALERIQMKRPEDPVETLALYLYRSTSTSSKRVKELTELKSVKSQLRARIKDQYDVQGRI